MLLAVIGMGFGLSWLIPCGFGTDCCSALNLAVSKKLGMSFGNWQALLNILLFLVILPLDRKQIGWGTLGNMLLVGYSCDFFNWLWDHVLPADLFLLLSTRILIAIPALLFFVLAAAIYMDMDLGVAPYDALAFILYHKVLKEKYSFRTIRIGYDLTVVLLGYLFGAPFAAITLAMAFLLGPAVTAVGNRLIPLLRLNK